MNVPHLIVVGSGVAGLSAVRRALRDGARVTLVIPGPSITASCGNTQLAQGGVAAAIGAGDDPELHARDTEAAGAGLSDPRAVRVLTRAGAREMLALIDSGFAVDRGADGAPLAGLEGAHGIPRIVHAGEDRTGAALHAFLAEDVARMQRMPAGRRLEVRTGRELAALLITDGAVRGIVVRDTERANAPEERFRADAVVLATGGYAGMYPRSSSAAPITGSGILVAARAGALLADLEFVQFHPTVIDGTRHLISEAVRGAGAILRDDQGRRFMVDHHPLADLAPRDVVARAMHRVMHEAGGGVWLDATPIEREAAGSLRARFAGISAVLDGLGMDWRRDPIPVAPAAHYTMGGIATDRAGRSSVPGLFAAGEAAATGVHGANRLASNSLLEGLVFGARAAAAAADYAAERRWGDPVASLRPDRLIVPVARGAGAAGGSDPTARGAVAAEDTIASALGIVRSGDELRQAGRRLRSAVSDAPASVGSSGSAAELALLVVAAAEARTESRGAHFRTDFVRSDPDQAVRRAVSAVFESAQPGRQPVAVPEIRDTVTRDTEENHPC